MESPQEVAEEIHVCFAVLTFNNDIGYTNRTLTI
jgi:hypothetical protein